VFNFFGGRRDYLVKGMVAFSSGTMDYLRGGKQGIGRFIYFFEGEDSLDNNLLIDLLPWWTKLVTVTNQDLALSRWPTDGLLICSCHLFTWPCLIPLIAGGIRLSKCDILWKCLVLY
jgi:hypothetical protein